MAAGDSNETSDILRNIAGKVLREYLMSGHGFVENQGQRMIAAEYADGTRIVSDLQYNIGHLTGDPSAIRRTRAERSPQCRHGPNGLVLPPDEKTLFVAESPLHRITAISLAGGAKRLFCVTGTVGGGDGMRLSRDGFLYAAIYGEGVIAKISMQGEVVHRYDIQVGQHPTNLCFASDGRSLYVTETDTNTIIQVRL